MNMSASICSALCLMICAGCSTTDPLVRTEYIRERPPEELLRACEPPTERPVAITEDIIDNWLAADAAYQECAARVLRLKGWYNSPRP